MKKSYVGKTLLALGGAAVLAGCATTKDLPDNASLAESVQITVKKYIQDKQLDVSELQALGSAYVRVDNAIQDGIKDEAEKKLLTERRELLGKLVTAYFEGGNFRAYGFVSGMEPGYTKLRNNGGQTPLPLRLPEEEKTLAETFPETRARAEFLARIREAWASVGGAAKEEIDNKKFHAAFREVAQATLYQLLATKTPYGTFGGRDGEAKWTKEMHEAYFGKDSKEGKDGNHTAIGLVGEEPFKVSDELEKTVLEALGEKTDAAKDDSAAAFEKAQKAFDEAKKKLEEAQKAKEEAAKKAKEETEKAKAAAGAGAEGAPK